MARLCNWLRKLLSTACTLREVDWPGLHQIPACSRKKMPLATASSLIWARALFFQSALWLESGRSRRPQAGPCGRTTWPRECFFHLPQRPLGLCRQNAPGAMAPSVTGRRREPARRNGPTHIPRRKWPCLQPSPPRPVWICRCYVGAARLVRPSRGAPSHVACWYCLRPRPVQPGASSPTHVCDLPGGVDGSYCFTRLSVLLSEWLKSLP